MQKKNLKDMTAKYNKAYSNSIKYKHKGEVDRSRYERVVMELRRDVEAYRTGSYQDNDDSDTLMLQTGHASNASMTGTSLDQNATSQPESHSPNPTNASAPFKSSNTAIDAATTSNEPNLESSQVLDYLPQKYSFDNSVLASP